MCSGIRKTSQRPKNFDVDAIRQRPPWQSDGEAKVWIATGTVSSLRIRANLIGSLRLGPQT